MAMTKNAREAWDLRLSMVEYQDPGWRGAGQYKRQEQYVRISTKPPLYGYAVVYIWIISMCRIDTDDYENL
jgi:hypothetical protein